LYSLSLLKAFNDIQRHPQAGLRSDLPKQTKALGHLTLPKWHCQTSSFWEVNGIERLNLRFPINQLATNVEIIPALNLSGFLASLNMFKLLFSWVRVLFLDIKMEVPRAREPNQKTSSNANAC
jgi:hypothetical protein